MDGKELRIQAIAARIAKEEQEIREHSRGNKPENKAKTPRKPRKKPTKSPDFFAFRAEKVREYQEKHEEIGEIRYCDICDNVIPKYQLGKRCSDECRKQALAIRHQRNCEKYREKNKSKISEHDKAYYQANRDKVRESQRLAYRKRTDTIGASGKQSG